MSVCSSVSFSLRPFVCLSVLLSVCPYVGRRDLAQATDARGALLPPVHIVNM